MAETPPENLRADEDVPPENQTPVVEFPPGGIPLGFERLGAPGAISLAVGTTELGVAGTYTLANGTVDGQEKVIRTPVSGWGVGHDFNPAVHCKFWKGFQQNYDPGTTGQHVGLRGPMTFVHLKWCVGIPTQDWGPQDCWVIVASTGLNEFDTGNDIVSEISMYGGAAPS